MADEIDDSWFYEGGPCTTLQRGAPYDFGLTCTAFKSHGDFCAPCRRALRQCLAELPAGALDSIETDAKAIKGEILKIERGE